MTDIDLAAIRERVDAATPGPWENAVATYAPMTRDQRADWLRDTLNEGEDLHLWAMQVPGEDYATIPAVTGDGPNARANAGFIAHARTDIPALLAEVERLRAERDALGEAAFSAYMNAGGDPDTAQDWQQFFRPIKSSSWEKVVREAVQQQGRDWDDLDREYEALQKRAADVDGLARVYAAHARRTGIRDARQHCICGWKSERMGKGHATHQAAAVSAWLLGEER